MPEQECSSSEKRRGPSERSWTRRAVHFAPMISAQQASAHVSSCTSFMVRIATLPVYSVRLRATCCSMIDLHSHILPGVDDGPATIEESLEIARRAAADGVRVIAATPHVRDRPPRD